MELIQQAVHVYGWKVLVTAPSNVAVDNVLARLVVVDPVKTKSSIGGSSSGSSKRHTKHSKVRVVRLGHPARLQEAILPYSLEAMVQAADGTDIVDSVRAELQSNLRLLSSSSSSSIPKKRRDTTAIKRQLVYREIKALRKEVRVREEKVVTELMTSAQVVLTTCVGAGNSKLLRDLQFDMVVIDEAAQALEAACWIPALQAKTKLVLAGGTCDVWVCICCAFVA